MSCVLITEQADGCCFEEEARYFIVWKMLLFNDAHFIPGKYKGQYSYIV